jgi:hypothetical protein
LRHRQPVSRGVEAAGIGVRAEQSHAAIFKGVGLQSFKNLLRIMEHGRRRIERERATRMDARIMPALPFGVTDRDHMICEGFAESGVLQQRSAGLRCGGVRMGFAGKAEAHGNFLANNDVNRDILFLKAALRPND